MLFMYKIEYYITEVIMLCYHASYRSIHQHSISKQFNYQVHPLLAAYL